MNDEFKQADENLIPAMLYRTTMTPQEYQEWFNEQYNTFDESIYISEKLLKDIVECFKYSLKECGEVTYLVFRKKTCKDKKAKTFFAKFRNFVFGDPSNEFLRIYLKNKFFIDISMSTLCLVNDISEIHTLISANVKMLKSVNEENKEN